MKSTTRAPRPASCRRNRISFLLLAVLLVATAFLASLSTPAAAAATHWLQSRGAKVRIVATPPDADGVIRAAVDIDLKPGWTTYWRNPGESGIPPQLTTTGSRNIKSARLDFPPPVALDEGGMSAIGYDAPVALPLRIRQAEPGKDSLLSAKLFLGVCKDICIPVRADFSLNIPAHSKPASSIASVVVAKAFTSLPEPESDTFAVRQVSLSKDGRDLIVTARLPGGAPPGDRPQLFVAGPDGWSVAPARLKQQQGRMATFFVPVTGKPDAPSGAAKFILVVRDGLRSIEATKALQ